MNDLSAPISPLISPTKARRDAAQAKDWAHVLSWLTKKYSPQSVPRFERNVETLRALLELVAVNEAADWEADLIHRAEEEELSRYEAADRREADRPCREMLGVLVDNLDECGTQAVQELAEASVLLGTLSPDPIVMGERIVEMTHERFEMEEQLRRVSDLQSRLERELVMMRENIGYIQSQENEIEHEEMQQHTAQLNREMKQFITKTGEYDEQIVALERFSITSPDVTEVKEQEQVVKKLQANIKSLERHVAGFHGLPPDLEVARGEFQRAKNELQELKGRRNDLFQEMMSV